MPHLSIKICLVGVSQTSLLNHTILTITRQLGPYPAQSGEPVRNTQTVEFLERCSRDPYDSKSNVVYSAPPTCLRLCLCTDGAAYLVWIVVVRPTSTHKLEVCIGNRPVPRVSV